MSIGNLRDEGNQSKNYPWQLKVLLGLQQIHDVNVDCCDNTLGKLDEIYTLLQGTARTPNISSETGAGATPSAYSISIANVGSAAGVINGVSIPAGTVLNFDPGMNNTVDPMSFNATGTTFIITSIQ